jgi:large subunit ribosomal protein L4
MESIIYNAEGKKSGSINLPEMLFGQPWNASLIHQVVTSMQDNARVNVAHAKGRGEVRGGGKKPWQQKGTGRARAGSSRSPIWRGGGITHGPNKNEVFARAIPKKMRAKALILALSQKMRDGEVIFVDSFGLEAPKTAAARKTLMALSKVKGLERLATKPKNAALIAFADPTEASIKSFRNLASVKTASVRDLNPVTVLGNSYLVIENPAAAIAILETRMSRKSLGAPVTEKAEAKPSARPGKKTAKPAAKKAAKKTTK